VLDEGHTIKNSRTQQAQAATALRADRRWILSGTPVQNNLDDLHGQLAFLKLEPLNDKYYFTRTIARPIKDGDLRGFYKLQVLMHAIAMRRTKDMQVGGQPLVSLPSKTVHVVEVIWCGGICGTWAETFKLVMKNCGALMHRGVGG